MKHLHLFGDHLGAVRDSRPSIDSEVGVKGLWHFICRDPSGRVKWVDDIENLVTNAGLNHLLDVTLSGGTQDTTWFVGLMSGTPTVAAADTLASHAGWTEVGAYTEVNRPAWVDGGAASQSISNTASPAVFTIDVNATTIGGAFLAGVTTGTAGVLYAAGAFAVGNKVLDANDTLTVTATFTAAAA